MIYVPRHERVHGIKSLGKRQASCHHTLRGGLLLPTGPQQFCPVPATQFAGCLGRTLLLLPAAAVIHFTVRAMRHVPWIAHKEAPQGKSGCSRDCHTPVAVSIGLTWVLTTACADVVDRSITQRGIGFWRDLESLNGLGTFNKCSRKMFTR